MRTIPTFALAEMFRMDQSDPFLFLLTINMYTAQYYCVNNTDRIVSRGINFEPWPFEITLPEESETEQTRTSIKIDNVDPILWNIARSITQPPLVTIELILASQPSVILFSVPNLKLRQASATARSIEAELMVDTVWQVRYPADAYTPAQFPGLFRL